MKNFVTRKTSHGLLKRHSDTQLAERADENCEPADPANTVTDRLNTLLQNSGDGYVLSLCPSQTYMIQAPILFAHPNQEISTLGYPRDNTRAVISVAGPVMNGQGHTTAVDGTCSTCSGVKLRNVQIDGARRGAAPTNGGGNIEMGGGNSNQLIEFVHSWDPRSWTCLHIAEGPLSCSGVTIQNNDIGPCGSDAFQEWADGISVSCRDSVVRNNMIQDPTDGGIVVFGSPGTQVYNNTIWILNATLLGGINLVDYDPWNGDFTSTVVRDNVILGGFATDEPDNDTKGNNAENAIIKIGIAIGPKTWFGDRYGNNVVKNGVVQNNKLSGAFSYGIAATSATNFTIQGNAMFGNTSFIGARGPLCTDSDVVPTPGPFILDPTTTTDMSVQSDFQHSNEADAFTCVLPPNGGDFWPFGLNPSNSSTSAGTNGTKPTSGNTAGVAIGVIVAVIATAIITWFARKKIIAHREAAHHFKATKQTEYNQKI
ncbi:hypothetical protein JR316_0004402 [Psilocybe cubensis]|uniref:Uncharacterized protein n=2 Tax=Psilocybe cubensis TaxID=181762 RepID=A0ACB8H381_PSICU|nr:hypothetical protein JR316_0004402 [Psilocybe cubensis]KAH9482304.1 hypothetical protein JR316_0004402 [Psilocybe cubensis]